jgi:hypothetical protein
VLAIGCSRASSSSGDWVPDDIVEQQTLESPRLRRLREAVQRIRRLRARSISLELPGQGCVHRARAAKTTSDAVMCGEALDTCLDTLPPVVDQQLNMILAQASCSAAAIDPATCGSKVSALTACLDALGDQVDELMLSATCAAFGSPVTRELVDDQRAGRVRRAAAPVVSRA